MATLSLTTITNGTTADGSVVNTNFQAIKTLLETTKLDPTNLTAPKSDCVLMFTHAGQLGTSVTKEFRCKIPSGVTFEPTSAQLCIDTLAGGGTCSLDILVGAASVLNSVCTATAVDTMGVVTSFAASTIAAAAVVIFRLVETSGAGTVSDVSMTLWGKTTHRS